MKKAEPKPQCIDLTDSADVVQELLDSVKVPLDLTECPGCLDELVTLNEKVELSCGHIFCSRCIIMWRKLLSICPFCHEPISKLIKTNLYGITVENVKPQKAPDVTKKAALKPKETIIPFDACRQCFEEEGDGDQAEFECSQCFDMVCEKHSQKVGRTNKRLCSQCKVSKKRVKQ